MMFMGREGVWLNPCIGVGKLMERVKVEVFVGGDVYGEGFEDVGYCGGHVVSRNEMG